MAPLSLDDVWPTEKIALEIVEAKGLAVRESLLRFHLLREQLRIVVPQEGHVLLQGMAVHGEHVDLDHLGQFNEWTQMLLVDAIIKGNSIALTGEALDRFEY